MRLALTYILLFIFSFAVGQSNHVVRFSGLAGEERIAALAVDDAGVAYAVTNERMYLFDGNALQRVCDFPVPLRSPISFSIHDHQFYIGDRNATILIYNSDFNVQLHKKLAMPKGIKKIEVERDAIYAFAKNQVQRVDNERDNILLATDDFELYDAAFTDDEHIFLATDAGLKKFKLESDTLLLTETYGLDEGLSDIIILTLCQRDEKLFLGTYEGGVNILDMRANEIGQQAIGDGSGSVDFIGKVDQDRVVFRTKDGLFFLHPVDLSVRQALDMDQQQVDFLPAQGPNESFIFGLSDNDEMVKLDMRFDVFQPTLTEEIRAVASIDPSTLLLGTEQGISVFDRSTGAVLPIPSGRGMNVVCMHETDAGTFIGTFSDGLFFYDENRGGVSAISSFDGLKNNSVISIQQVADSLWVSTLAGVYRAPINREKGSVAVESFVALDQIRNKYVYDMVGDSSGAIYFATDGNGLQCWNQGEIWSSTDSTRTQAHLTSLIMDKRQGVYAVDQASGLSYFGDLNSFAQLVVPATKKQEMNAVSTFSTGELVIAFDDEITLFDDAGTARFTIGEEQGLHSIQPILNGIITEEQHVIIPSVDKLIRVHAPRDGMVEELVEIQEVIAGNENITQLAEPKVSYSQNSVLFRISSIDYQQAQTSIIEYRLIGLDSTWVRSIDRNILLANLRHGQYDFQIRRAGDKAIRDHFSFTVARPWWQNIFVLLSFVGLLGGLVYLYVRMRERELKRENDLNRANIERQYEELKNQLNPHFLFNALNSLIEYIEEEPEIAVDFTERLADFYRKLLEFNGTKLISLEQEMALVDDYVYLLNKRFGDNLIIDKKIVDATVALPPMTLQLLVENAVKHNVLSAREPLVISLYQSDRSRMVVVNKKRIRRRTAKSTGIGLKNIVRRYELLGFQPPVVSDESDTFSVEIALILNGDDEHSDR